MYVKEKVKLLQKEPENKEAEKIEEHKALQGQLLEIDQNCFFLNES